MNPIYEISATIKLGINFFRKFHSESLLRFCLEKIKNSFNENASKLSIEQLNECLGYLDNLSAYLTNSLTALANYGVDISNAEKTNAGCEKQVEQSSTAEYDFYKDALADFWESLSNQARLINIALKVIAIGKEELNKYLPNRPTASASEKVLNLTDNK